jgi:hypothetical protein
VRVDAIVCAVFLPVLGRVLTINQRCHKGYILLDGRCMRLARQGKGRGSNLGFRGDYHRHVLHGQTVNIPIASRLLLDTDPDCRTISKHSL